MGIEDTVSSPLSKAKTVAEAKSIMREIYSPDSPSKIANPMFEVPRMRSLSN